MSQYYPQEPPGDPYYDRRPDPRGPPPRRHPDDYPPDAYAPRYPPSQDYGYDNDAPPPRRPSAVPAGGGDPLPTQDNQLAPYDEEKAFAEYERGYRQGPMYNRPPPPDDYDRYERPPPRRHRSRDRYDDRYGDPYDDRERDRYERDMRDMRDVRDVRDDRDRRHLDREHKPHEGERDLAATLIGGASGAFIGNRVVGKGALGTLGGAVVGALGANAVEHYEEKKKRQKEEHRTRIRREFDGDVYDPRGSRSSDVFASGSRDVPVSDGRGSRAPPRRPRRRPRRGESSSDSYTSDE